MTDDGATDCARRRWEARETTTVTRGREKQRRRRPEWREHLRGTTDTQWRHTTGGKMEPADIRAPNATRTARLRYNDESDCASTLLLATQDRALNLETSSVPVSKRSKPAAVAEAPDSSGGETRTRLRQCGNGLSGRAALMALLLIAEVISLVGWSDCVRIYSANVGWRHKTIPLAWTCNVSGNVSNQLCNVA